jgi:hypothetical protein
MYQYATTRLATKWAKQRGAAAAATIHLYANHTCRYQVPIARLLAHTPTYWMNPILTEVRRD